MTNFQDSGARPERVNHNRTLASRSLMPAGRKTIDLPYVKNQSPLPGQEVQCCVSAAITACVEHLASDPQNTELSMLYHYFQVSPFNPQGVMTLSEGLVAAEDEGICRLELHPFVVDFNGVSISPSSLAYDDALDRKVDLSSQPDGIWSLKTWKDCLDENLPLILIFYLNRELYFSIPENNFTHPPLSGPRPGYGHAVTVVGYDDFEKHFTIQDCRGTGFAKHGTWYLPYSIAQSPDFTDALGIIRKII